SPELFEKEAVKVATWGNQWVAFDDEDTLRLKSEFAQSLCLGGLIVWAISHDTKDAKYNKALAKVANRKITSLPIKDGSDDPYQYVNYPNPQCKWTNCGE
ncbi:glycoside hydrolase family 18 protein, partial [Lentithecium fluviatile CBS 122367]